MNKNPEFLTIKVEGEKHSIEYGDVAIAVVMKDISHERHVFCGASNGAGCREIF